jgi:imidazolonepropionase-like amidohydrolase
MVIAIRCGTLFDATGVPPVRNASLIVDGTRITAVGAGIEVPPDADIVDLSNCFVMPGLIDAHSHISIDPGKGDQTGQMRTPIARRALWATDYLRRDLLAGTTTMRIMAEEEFLDLEVRRAIDAGTVIGPHLLCATRGITASNGHGRALSSFDGPDSIRRAVRENFAQGADHVKLFTTGGVSTPGSTLQASGYSREEIRAAVEEAERVGRYAAAHAHGGPGLRWALEEGVSTIEHGALATDEDVRLMIDKGAWLICTFSVLFHPTGIEQGDASQPAIMQKVHWAREVVNASFPRILESGVQYAVGTDSMHGLMSYELATLVRLGVSPHDALLAGTRSGAAACRVLERTGTLEPGKDADIIGLVADPLADIDALRDVVFVMRGGVIYKHAAGVSSAARAPVQMSVA